MFIPVVTVVTFFVNLWAGLSILKKEKNRVHCLIILDCLLNVFSALHHTILFVSGWTIFTSSASCLLNAFLLFLLMSWNKLVPVVIAAFRYILVCHSVFVHNHGGEKAVGGSPFFMIFVVLFVCRAAQLVAAWQLGCEKMERE